MCPSPPATYHWHEPHPRHAKSSLAATFCTSSEQTMSMISGLFTSHLINVPAIKITGFCHQNFGHLNEIVHASSKSKENDSSCSREMSGFEPSLKCPILNINMLGVAAAAALLHILLVYFSMFSNDTHTHHQNEQSSLITTWWRKKSAEEFL